MASNTAVWGRRREKERGGERRKEEGKKGSEKVQKCKRGEIEEELD